MTIDFKEKPSQARSFINSLRWGLDEVPEIYNFNYTNSLESYIDSHVEQIFVHGSIKDKNIIFGFDDKGTDMLENSLKPLKK